MSRPLVRLVIPAVLFYLSTGCGLLLDLDPPDTPTGGSELDPNAFFCEAEIFRHSGVELVEHWEAWVFPADRNGDGVVDIADGDQTCREKLDQYVARAMAPGFAWQTRGLTVVEGGSGHLNPLLRKGPASECPADPIGPTFSTGGPRGGVVVRENPTEDEASVQIHSNFDDEPASATPPVRLWTMRFAERHGLPGDAGGYDRTRRHVRMSDVLLEVATPFTLGDVEADRLYIQGVGTIYGEQVEDSTSYRIHAGPRAKMFFFGRGRAGGEGDLSSFCFTGTTNVLVSQGPEPSVVFSAVLGREAFGDEPLLVLIRLSTDDALQHQPFLRIADAVTSDLAVDLGPGASDVVMDNDGDLSRVLWFESFETADERFLGIGLPATVVRFSPGMHEIWAIAYDSRGAYSFDTMNLSVLEPNVAADAYTAEEDQPLVVAAPGVMANDTDAGVPRTTVLAGLPTNGTLTLEPNGGFTYTPDPDFVGTDTFSYRVDHDGLALSNLATVTITVVELTAQEEVENIKEGLPALVEDGTLTEGEANSLDSLLQEAIDELDRGHHESACRKLAAFIRHVEGLLAAGILTEPQAAGLIAAVENVLAEEGCAIL